MSVTLSTLRTIGYAIMREEEDSSAYPYIFMDQLLNTAQLSLCSGTMINPLTKEAIGKWQLPFLNTDKYYSNVRPVTLTTTTTVGAVTLEVADTTDFLSSGSLYLWWQIVTYTNKTATEFTGVSWVLFAYPSGTEVSQAFVLPNDYMSPVNVIYNNRVQLENKLYDNIFNELKDYKGTTYNRVDTISPFESPYSVNPFYTIKDNQHLLIYNLSKTGDPIHLRYEKLPTEMTTSSSVSVISNDIYAKSTIPYLAIWEFLYNRWEEWRWAELFNLGLTKTREMYAFYNKSSKEKDNWKKYIMWKWKLNI